MQNNDIPIPDHPWVGDLNTALAKPALKPLQNLHPQRLDQPLKEAFKKREGNIKDMKELCEGDSRLQNMLTELETTKKADARDTSSSSGPPALQLVVVAPSQTQLAVNRGTDAVRKQKPLVRSQAEQFRQSFLSTYPVKHGLTSNDIVAQILPLFDKQPWSFPRSAW